MNKPAPGTLRPAESLPWQEVSLDVLREKYAKGPERDLDGPDMARAVRRRVAQALAAVETDPDQWEPRFLEALEAGAVVVMIRRPAAPDGVELVPDAAGALRVLI